MTEFWSCLSSLAFSSTRAGRSFLFQESLRDHNARVLQGQIFIDAVIANLTACAAEASAEIAVGTAWVFSGRKHGLGQSCHL
jgi:hypothetical protein